MRRWIVLCALLAACNPPHEEGAVGRGPAGLGDKAFSFEQLERRVLARGGAAGVEARALLPLYRDAAERLAAESILRDDEALVAEAHQHWETDLEVLRRTAVAQAYAARRVERVPAVTTEEVATYYREHPDEFEISERRYVYHLFKRADTAGEKAAARELLESLRRRVLSGESFSTLARENSDSETRSVGGLLGWVERGRLPEGLDSVAFSLPEGGVSEPIPVTGGLILLHVQEAVAGRRLELPEVEASIRKELNTRRVAEHIDAELADLSSGVTEVLHPAAEIADRHALADEEPVLVSEGGLSVAAGVVRRLLLGERVGGDQPPTPAEIAQRFEQLVRMLELYRKALLEGFPHGPEEEGLTERLVGRLQEPFLIERLTETAVRREIDRHPEDLQAFFEANRARYQSPLRWKLRMLVVDDLSAFPRLLDQLEKLHASAETGPVDLDGAAARLGGKVVDLGWVAFDDLGILPPKVRQYLFDVRGRGLTQPFQHDRSLRVLEVAERQEPTPLEYDEVADRVEEDYFERNGQTAYRNWLGRTLEKRGFYFDAAAVSAAIAGAAPAAAATSLDEP